MNSNTQLNETILIQETKPSNSNHTIKNSVKNNRSTNTTQNRTNTTSSHNNREEKTNNSSKATSLVKQTSKQNQWKIVIPKINLEAPIAEGTSSQVMDAYVGHFENTAILEGNIGLAAHNRGYPVNYFQNIKKLEKGDTIEYYLGEEKKTYEVQIVTVISDTDWTYLAQNGKNTITLITCVENKPEYRRCIQAVEI